MIKYWIIRACNKICKLTGITKYYQTKSGIKVFNRKRGKAVSYVDEEILWVRPESLLLGVDGINDQQTLLGCHCVTSPHRFFVEACHTGDLRGCDYIRRERNGTLDGRDSFYISEAQHIATYKEKLSEYEDMKPVLVYEVNGQMYIADGKHRAAYLSSRSSDIPVRRIKLGEADIEYFKNIRKIMLKHKDRYSKNLSLIEAIIESV